MLMPFISSFYKQILIGTFMVGMLPHMGETNAAKPCFLVVPPGEMTSCVLEKLAPFSVLASQERHQLKVPPP